MKLLKLLAIMVAVAALVVAAGYFGRHELARYSEDLPPFTHSEGDTIEFMVQMEDGVKLYTSVMLPDGAESFPTILVRNPYVEFGDVLRDTLCGRFVRYGYACAFQDVRGQGKSEGEWNPGVNEVRDGRDTINWLVDQSFQNGNVGMVGPSYLASVQYAVAASGLPPEVKTFVPAVYATDTSDVVYSNGMFRHETFTAWSSLMRGPDADVEDAGADYQKAIRHMPHNKVDTEVFGLAMPWYQQMIDIEAGNTSFINNEAAQAMRTVPESLGVPVLMVSGWYDIFTEAQVDDWQRLATRDNSRFIMGPWTHIGASGEAFEIENASGGLFQWQEMLPWLEHHLKGEPLKNPPGFHAYRMGENEWHHYDEWPGEVTMQSFELNRITNANDCGGGTLGGEAASGSISYEYDPMDPVPTRGGAGMLAFIIPGFEGAPPANVLQDGLCERDDVLSFVSDPLDSSLLIAGDIRVDLEVASSAPDTSFTAKLIEEFPDGRAINIRDAITSLAYRDGGTKPLPYTPGERISVTLDMWPIEWQVSAGSRLRLDISSSDFPKFHFHRNRAGPWAAQDGVDVATQTLYGGRLQLPVRE